MPDRLSPRSTSRRKLKRKEQHGARERRTESEGKQSGAGGPTVLRLLQSSIVNGCSGAVSLGPIQRRRKTKLWLT
eukprot:3934958-Rhodomonas_salina.3